MNIPERLVHYSKEPIQNLLSVKQESEGFKPGGFWFSVEGPDDWKEWCEAEEYRLDRLKCPHEVALSHSAKLLRLQDPLAIDAFTKAYAGEQRHSYYNPIDWPMIAREYQGIIIAPYCWERRLTSHTMWYYGWDCASGCIWDASAIESVKLREAAHV